MGRGGAAVVVLASWCHGAAEYDDPLPLAQETDVKAMWPARKVGAPAATPKVIQAISYNPFPPLSQNQKETDVDSRLPNEHVMGTWWTAQWHWMGRNDLGHIKRLGANSLSVPYSDAAVSSESFLDECNAFGLRVLVGLNSRAHVIRPASKPLPMDRYDHAIKEHRLRLKNGFVTKSSSGKPMYRPALDTLILAHEPEMDPDLQDVAPPSSYCATSACPKKDYMKSVVSTLDGIIAAEKEAGLDSLDTSVSLSVVFSDSPCPKCPSYERLESLGCCYPCGFAEQLPCSAIGQDDSWSMRCPDARPGAFGERCLSVAMVLDLHEAMEHPESVVGYKPKTSNPSLFDVYRKRWRHGLDVASIWSVTSMLDKYVQLSFNTGVSIRAMRPVFVSKLKHPYEPAKGFQASLSKALRLAKNASQPFKGIVLHEFQLDYAQPCNEAEWDKYKKDELSQDPCPWRSFGLFALGNLIVGETGSKNSKSRVPVYCLKQAHEGRLESVASAFGGEVPNTDVCDRGMDGDPTMYCVASRKVGKEVVNKKVAELCQKLAKDFDCTAALPSSCQHDWEKADWVFSLYSAFMGTEHCPEDGSWWSKEVPALITPIPPRPDCTVDADSVDESGDYENKDIVPPDRADSDGHSDISPRPPQAHRSGWRVFWMLSFFGAFGYCYMRRQQRIHSLRAEFQVDALNAASTAQNSLPGARGGFNVEMRNAQEGGYRDFGGS